MHGRLWEICSGQACPAEGAARAACLQQVEQWRAALDEAREDLDWGVPTRPAPAWHRMLWRLLWLGRWILGPLAWLTGQARYRAFGQAVAQHVATGMRLAPTEVIARRRDICRGCDHLDRTHDTCRLCGGCGVGEAMLSKTALADQQCPLDPPKWTRLV